MIRLHYANRLENLIAPLADAIAAQQRAQPLERVTIVVPGRAMEDYLKHRVAEALGIAANLEFPFLRNFLASTLATADPKIRILDIEELEQVLFESLRNALDSAAPEFQAPRGYVEAGRATADEKEIRVFRLARQLARLFRDYSIARRPMLQKWLRDDGNDLAVYSETERWQRQLWISTFDANGYLRAEWKYNPDYNWLLLPDAFEAVSASALKAALPDAVHVFALAYAGPAYLRIFAQLGKLTEVNLYALNPCLEFWEDVEHVRGVERASWARRHGKVGDADLERSDDPFGLAAARDTPALRLWGRPGREYIRMLNELTECDFDAHFTHLSTAQEFSLLANLQEDILNRAPAREPGESVRAQSALLDKESILFLACPGIAREAEIVANEIWSMLDSDRPQRDPLRFHQIGVMVPDALYQDYLPHIENAFRRLHQLPTNIVNRGERGESPVREAIGLLLRLALGRFSRDEMLHLLNHPAVRGDGPEVDTEQAARWCEEVGIFFGADAHDLADTYIPRDAYHWAQGIRRLALGVFMAAESDGEPCFYRAADALDYLPCAVAQDEVPAVAAFIGNARSLLSDAIEIKSSRLTLAQWAGRLSDLVSNHIQVDSPAEERIFERCLSAIESIAGAELRSSAVGYQIAYELVAARIAEVESQLAHFAEHGVVIGPLSALRSIPFRACFLMGLNEGQFPERDRRDPMDLRSLYRRAGDVSPLERDRYLFLETLLAARQRICFSYVARDAKTGDRLDPASVLQELQFILRGYLDSQSLEDLTIQHPLSRYDSDYFSDSHSKDLTTTHSLVSYDSEAQHGAAMAMLREDLAGHCGGTPLPGRDEPVFEQLSVEAQARVRSALRMVEISRTEARIGAVSEISLSISALRKFLECPLQGAAQYALGIFDDDGEGVEQWQDEPVAQSVLDRSNLLRGVFWKARGDREILLDEYARAFKLALLRGEAPAGPFAEAAERADRKSLTEWIAQAQEAGCGSLDLWREIRMGSGDEATKADDLIDELAIPLEVKQGAATERLVVKIRGSLGFVPPARNAALRLVLRDDARPKDFLAPFLTAIVLSAAGELSSARFDSIVIAAGKKKSRHTSRSLACPTPEQARAYLSDLLSDLLFDKNHYFLPLEAVEKLDKEIAAKRESDLQELVYEIREADQKPCSSDYGPIRDARRFEPPSSTALRRLMKRRFELIRAIFGKEKD